MGNDKPDLGERMNVAECLQAPNPVDATRPRPALECSPEPSVAAVYVILSADHDRSLHDTTSRKDPGWGKDVRADGRFEP